MVLKQSLLELMSNKPLNQITIKEICEAADVNRGTFYKHYNDQYDLLRQIQNELDVEIKAALDKNVAVTASAGDIIAEIISCITAQGALCKVLFSQHGDTAFLKRIMYNAHEQCISEWSSRQKPGDIKQLEMFYAFIANGITAILQNWLQSGMKETPGEIAVFIENAINYGLSSLLNPE